MKIQQKKRSYVYIISHTGYIVYIGEGVENRVESDKNEWFNVFDKDCKFKREIVKFGLTKKEAMTLESRLIRKYNPVFNRTKGLSPEKWVELPESSIETYINDHKMMSKGKTSATPRKIAKRLVKMIGKVNVYSSVLLPEDRYGVILGEFLKQNPQFKGTITILESDKNRLSSIFSESQDYSEIIIMRQDFLTHEFGEQKFDLVLMNPPFAGVQEEFVDKALSISKNLCAVLQRKWSKNNRGTKGKNSYRSHLDNIKTIYQVTSEEFKEAKSPVDLVVFSEEETISIDITLRTKDSTESFSADKSKYFLSYPIFPLDEYDYFFDQSSYDITQELKESEYDELDMSNPLKYFTKSTGRDPKNLKDYTGRFFEHRLISGDSKISKALLEELYEKYGNNLVSYVAGTGRRLLTIPPMRSTELK